MSYQPYNISFDDKSPLFYYLPYRGGYSSGPEPMHYGTDHDSWYAYNTTTIESSFTTYAVNASVALQWAGTAVWLHGEANATYTITRSWNASKIAGEGTAVVGGVLYSESGLPYGLNTLTLTVQEGPVTITGATITVGMGEPGSSIKATNISTIIEDIPAINPVFTVNSNGTWEGDLAFAPNNGLEPIILTTKQGDYVTFVVNSSVGFAVYGATDPMQGTFLVDIDPPVPNSPNTRTHLFNATTPWVEIEEIKYLATGLNRTQNYTVKLTNAQLGKEFNVGEVILFDAIPPTSSLSSTTVSSQTVSHGNPTNSGSVSVAASHEDLSRGAVAGIVVGSVAGILLIAFIALARFRRRRASIASYEIEPDLAEPKPDEQDAPPSSVGVQDLRAPEMATHPYMKAYVESPGSPPIEAADRPPRVASSSYRKSEEMTSTLILGAIVEGSSSSAEAPAPAPPPSSPPPPPVLPVHEEDAGPVPESLPPMYNPDWNSAQAQSTLEER